MSLLPIAGPFAFLLAVLPGTLRDARIRIKVRGDTAQVTARYRVAGTDSIGFTAIRVSAQNLVLAPRRGDPPVRIDTLPGLFRLTAGAQAGGVPSEISYRVIGDLSRIPLLVPDAPTAPGLSRVTIEVLGVSPDRAATFVFPRFAREREDAWLASPDHLPSFVTVVGSAGSLPVPALAQWSVLLLALGGTGAWLVAQGRARTRV